MKYSPGQSGNLSGRPRGLKGGRVRALQDLDRMMARSKGRGELIKALEDYMRDKPIEFFKTVVMPLLPKEAKLEVQSERIVRWENLLDVAQDVVEGRRKVGPPPAEGGG